MRLIDNRFDFLYILAAIAAFASGYATNLLQREHIVTRTVTRMLSVQQQYGKPDQTINGGQINQALAGLRCDVYASRKTIVCHP